MRENVLPIVVSYLGETNFLSAWLTENPLLLFLVLLLPFALILLVALLVDFIKDSWKVSFGLVLDLAVIFMFALFWPGLLLVMLAAGAVFFFLAEGPIQKGIYAGLAVLRVLIVLPFIPLPTALQMILLFAPLGMILAGLACITD